MNPLFKQSDNMGALSQGKDGIGRILPYLHKKRVLKDKTASIILNYQELMTVYRFEYRFEDILYFDFPKFKRTLNLKPYVK